MAVKGIFASDSNIIGSRKGDFASAILKNMPNGSAPLLAMSSGMKVKDAKDVIVTWFEENHLDGRARVTTGGGINSSATSLALLDASFIVPGAILMVEATGEFLFVTAVTGNTLTIERGFTGTAADSIANSAYLQKIGTAQEEGSSRPTAVAGLGFPMFNYCQIFRNSWDVTGTARAVEHHTGDPVAKNKKDAAMLHAEDIERSLIWGRKHITTRNGKPFRTMDGINVQITTNVVAEGGNTTWQELTDFFEGVFAYNIQGSPNERIAYCGNKVLNVLQKIARLNSETNIEPGQAEFGWKINKLLTPFGDVTLMTHPLMNQSALFTKDLYVYHPAAIVKRPLRETTHDGYDSEGRRAGVDADYGVFTTELSCEYNCEKTGGKFVGITTAAADA